MVIATRQTGAVTQKASSAKVTKTVPIAAMAAVKRRPAATLARSRQAERTSCWGVASAVTEMAPYWSMVLSLRARWRAASWLLRYSVGSIAAMRQDDASANKINSLVTLHFDLDQLRA